MKLELKKPFVSIIVTCHNLGEYLCECIKSIENQTYKNYEIIIVDDASDENTKEIIEKNFKNKCALAKFFSSSEIRVIDIQKNEGQLGAFLQGLKVARGEFICLVDADDVLFEDYLSTHLQVHMNTNVAFTSAAQVEIDHKSTMHSLCSCANPLFKNNGGIFEKKDADKIFEIENKSFEVKVQKSSDLTFGSWVWNPATSAMMRKSSLDFLFLFKNLENYKTRADKLIFQFLQILGGSAQIGVPLWACRRRNNDTDENKLLGDFKYLKSSQLKKITSQNKAIKRDILKFLIDNYHYFCARLNCTNVRKLICRVAFSINLRK